MPPAEVEADHVIVGAGSAGCGPADRLSENGRHQDMTPCPAAQSEAALAARAAELFLADAS